MHPQIGHDVDGGCGHASFPHLRTEGMGTMAANVWGKQDLVRMMLPCEALRWSGTFELEEDSDAEADDGRCY